MGGDRDILREQLSYLDETLRLITLNLYETRESTDEVLANMIEGAREELLVAINILTKEEIIKDEVCTKAALELERLNVKTFFSSFLDRIKGKKEKAKGKEHDEKNFRSFFRRLLPPLFSGLQALLDKLSDLLAGTPLEGIFKNLSKICGMLSGASGVTSELSV